MSTSNSDRNTSENVLAFPAGRRNVQWYNSRILSEDNFRRSFQTAIPSPAGGGTIILDYARDSSQYSDLTKIAFLIQGYYFYLDNPEDDTLRAINAAIGEQSGECWVYIKQVYVEGDPEEFAPVTDFMEFECSDDSGTFYGLYHSSEDPEDEDLKIPIVVTDGSGKGDINPAIDATEDGDYYKPWFMSSATWAAGPFSDKNKIWVDDIYNVPHVCIQVGDNKRWLPLGAVYKTSRNGTSTTND